MNLQHIAPGLVQPSYNNNVVARRETVKPLCHQRTHFKPGVGRTLRTLLGRFAAFLDARTDDANGPKLCAASTLPACSHPLSSSLLGLHRESLLSASLSFGPQEAARSSFAEARGVGDRLDLDDLSALYCKAKYRRQPPAANFRTLAMNCNPNLD